MGHVKGFWNEFFTVIRQWKLIPKEPLFLRSLCLNKKFKESAVDVKLHIEATGSPADDETYKVITTPSAHAVTVTFDGGSRKNGHRVHRAFAQWLEVNGYGLDGTMFNVPHISGLDDPDPEHWVNEWGFKLIKKWDSPDKT
jgi:hypothetical protein